jgi:hypothetical protein
MFASALGFVEFAEPIRRARGYCCSNSRRTSGGPPDNHTPTLYVMCWNRGFAAAAEMGARRRNYRAGTPGSFGSINDCQDSDAVEDCREIEAGHSLPYPTELGRSMAVPTPVSHSRSHSLDIYEP